MGLLVAVVRSHHLIGVAASALTMQTARLVIRVGFGELMTVLAAGLRRIAGASSVVDQWRHWFQVCRIDAILVQASSFAHMIKLHSVRYRADEQFPDQSMAQWSSAFPVGQCVAILAHWMPQPASRGLKDCDLVLKAYGQVSEVHRWAS